MRTGGIFDTLADHSQRINGSGRFELDQRIGQLDSVGIAHDDAMNATASRILPVRDPDGNQIVFTGALGGR